MSNYAYPAPAAAPKGMAVASMVVGIASLVLAWPFAVGGVPGGIVALVLGIVGRKKGQSKGMTLTGIITGSVAIVLGILSTILVLAIFGAALSDPAFRELQ